MPYDLRSLSAQAAAFALVDGVVIVVGIGRDAEASKVGSGSMSQTGSVDGLDPSCSRAERIP